MTFSEEQLRLATREASRALVDSLPVPEDCRHDFSLDYQRKMARLLRRSRHLGLYHGLQRAACFFLAILLSGGAWLGVDAEARAVVFGWLSEKAEDAQRYFYSGEPTSSEDLVRYQIDVPDEYWLESRYADETYINEYYINGVGEFINFIYMYQTATSGGEMYIIDTGAEKKAVYVHDTPADLYLADAEGDSNTVVWTEPDTGALFDVTACMAEDELLALAESVSQKEK